MRIHRLCRITRSGLLFGALILTTGCAPLRVGFDISFAKSGLSETIIHRDSGASSAKVAVIHVSGVIADVSQPPGLFGGGPNPVDRFVAALSRAERDSSVKAVVVRINSPGGTVTGSDIMHREARAFSDRSGKPVVASLGEVAASGGYYLALASDHIVAEPTSTTGSIGVIFQTTNFSEGLARIGVHSRALTSAPNKDLANPFAPEREQHYEILQGLVNEFYARFRGLVMERRPGLDQSRLDEATDGRVFTGATAETLGLVDSTGGVLDAFGEAKRLASLESARMVVYHEAGARPSSVYSASSQAQASGEAPSSGATIDLAPIVSALTGPTGFYYLWTP